MNGNSDRLFWGIEFTGARLDKMLLFTAWHRAANLANQKYPDEPYHVLLFKTRKFARQYCTEQHARYKEIGGVCAQWKFSPVRVRELIYKIS